jgi:hypothetical protein
VGRGIRRVRSASLRMGERLHGVQEVVSSTPGGAPAAFADSFLAPVHFDASV